MNIFEQIGDWLSEVFTGKSRRRRASSRARRTGRTSSSNYLTSEDLERISRAPVPHHWPDDLDAIIRPRIGPVYHPEPTQEYLDRYAGLPLPKWGKDRQYTDVIDELWSTVHAWADYYGFEKAGEIAERYTDAQQYELLNLYMLNDNGHSLIYYVYLLLKWHPHLSLRAAMNYATQIAGAMDAFEDYDKPAWSPLEITNWYNDLDTRYKSQLESKIRSKKARGATNEQIYEYLCEQRYQVDEWLRQEKVQEQEEREANKISLLEAWYIWSEQGRKHEEHEYFKRENRKARGY